MQRRDFLKLSGVCAAALVLGAPERLSAAFPGTNTYPKMVSTILLDGGPDFRFLFVPKPEATGWSGSYAEAFWEARRDLYDTDSIAGYDNLTTDLERATAIYGANYEDVTLSGETFGILNYAQDAVNFDCTWLKAQITLGNVAIISNVVGSTNRDHHHSMMMLESGDMTTGPHDAGVSGWVGRAASALGEKAISLSRNVRMICNGPHPTDPKNHENSCVISAPDTRNTSLYDHETAALMAANDESYMWDQSRIMGRALESYYAAKNASVAATSPYRRFFDHEQSIRSFGAQVNSVLADVTSPAILDYHTGGNLDYIGSDMSKNTDSDYFARQISGLYDAMACRNVLQMRFASLEYPGWDSHKWQQEFVGPKLAYLFGSGKTLDSWYTQTELAASGSTDGQRTVWSLSSPESLADSCGPMAATAPITAAATVSS